MRLAVVLVAYVLFTPVVLAEPIDQIRVGTTVYLTGFFHDPKAEVLEVDKPGNRVKVWDKTANEILWVRPSRILNTTDSTSRDMERLELGARVLGTLLKELTEEPWEPGSRHPSQPNVVAAEQEKVWQPAPGFRWVERGKSWAVRWSPGDPHPRHPKWQAGGQPSTWRPLPGYVQVDRTWMVRWTPGRQHPSHPIWYAAGNEGKWTLKPGYQQVGQSWSARWTLGLPHPDREDMVAGPQPDQWITLVQLGAYRDEQDVKTMRDGTPASQVPPLGGEAIFEPGGVDLYVTLESGEVTVFFGRPLDFAAFSHLEYNYDKRWFSAVLQDGSRRPIGVWPSWQIHPYLASAREVRFIRTKDREIVRRADGSIEGAIYPLATFGGDHARAPESPRHRLGVQYQMDGAVDADGSKFESAARVVEVLDGSAAKSAGLEPGDLIVTVADEPVRYQQDLLDEITRSDGEPIRVGYVRAGRLLHEWIAPLPLEATQ